MLDGMAKNLGDMASTSASCGAIFAQKVPSAKARMVLLQGGVLGDGEGKDSECMA